MSFIIPAGIAMLGGMLGAGSVKKPDLIDPRQFQDELTYTNPEIASDVNMLSGKMGARSTKAIGDIKQAGAAGRLPEGAVLSGIAGVQGKAAEGVAGALPGLKRESRQSFANYTGMVNQFETQKTAYEQAGVDRGLQGLGNLGKIALLWSQGLMGEGV